MVKKERKDAIHKDAIIIGTGQAGKPLSFKLAKEGWNVLLVEKSRKDIGGACINSGCTPTKTLISSALHVQNVRNSSMYGINVNHFRVDYSKINRRKNYVVESFRSSIQNRINNADHLEIVYGKASFADSHTVVVESESKLPIYYSAPYIFIDAGSSPSIPDIKGLDKAPFYNSTSILDLEHLPSSLVIIGGSYIGVELGQMFHRLGSEVAIVERSAQIMPHEDKDISDSLMKLLEAEGMQFYLNASIHEVMKEQDGIAVLLDVSGTETPENKEMKLSGTHLLLATGRRPNSDELNLDVAGIITDKKGYIKVDGQLKTNVDGVYALGDIKGGPQFTHIAYNDFVVVSKNILEKKNVSIDGRPLPYCVYTDPQLGRIGLSEKQAKEKGVDYKVFKMKGTEVTRGIETGRQQGLWKAVVEQKSNKILGAAILCTEGGEVASVVQMAMEGGMGSDALAEAIFSHPSYTESLNILFQESNQTKEIGKF